MLNIKKFGFIQNDMFGLRPIKKMMPFKKILSQIMNGLHTNHFCSMGTIMEFLINMEVPTDASVMRHVQRVLIQNDDSDSH